MHCRTKLRTLNLISRTYITNDEISRSEHNVTIKHIGVLLDFPASSSKVTQQDLE